jgi:hypothetical protein
MGSSPPSPAFSVRLKCEHVFVRSPAELPPISQQDLHWLAGLLEGEGSFVPGPPSAPRSPGVQMCMADRDVVERAGALLGSPIWVARSRREGWSDVYTIRVRGARAVLWMERLRPLMGLRRQAQIDRAIASRGPDPRRLLDDKKATEALARLASGASVRQVAERFGTSIWCIYDLRLGRTHAHIERPAA